ncbi:unnamed protein product [Cylicocyclus nassatus]|uniref:Uncharacterized protein n=1 Tax=Cylicocyclus nassatus TaxID=53992 RepID=A0AA36DR03_CYLNA|nr:unnamed protein product [Cylicocyclus nassatus]
MFRLLEKLESGDLAAHIARSNGYVIPQSREVMCLHSFAFVKDECPDFNDLNNEVEERLRKKSKVQNYRVTKDCELVTLALDLSNKEITLDDCFWGQKGRGVAVVFYLADQNASYSEIAVQIVKRVKVVLGRPFVPRFGCSYSFAIFGTETYTAKLRSVCFFVQRRAGFNKEVLGRPTNEECEKVKKKLISDTPVV